MKKKVCKWLDSNEWGAVHFEENQVTACCNRSVPLITDVDDFSKVSVQELIKARKELLNGINDGSRKECAGCNLLKEKEENLIDLEKINALILLPFTTCNFRCSYCYLSKEQLSAKLNKNMRILPTIKNLYDNNFLTDNFLLCVGGGEPLLLEDIKDTIEFMNSNLKSSSFKLLSNSSLKNKAELLAQNIKDYKNVCKILYTSIDAGSEKTFKAVRNSKLFKQVVSNLHLYAESNTFDKITLKYIFMNNDINWKDQDLYGFANLLKEIKSKTASKLSVVLDVDITGRRINNDHLPDEQIRVIGKLYYYIHNILDIEIQWIGARLSDRSKEGLQDISKIKKFAFNYDSFDKSLAELIYLIFLLLPPFDLLRKKISSFFFSQYTLKNHNIITILGIKIKRRIKCQ